MLEQISGTARLWPHKVRGEGHFMAVLQREGELDLQAAEKDQAPWIQADGPDRGSLAVSPRTDSSRERKGNPLFGKSGRENPGEAATALRVSRHPAEAEEIVSQIRSRLTRSMPLSTSSCT